MKHTSMLDLIILHKGEEKSIQQNHKSWHGFGNIGCTLLKSQKKSLGMVALSLCCVASSQINILSVIVFPEEPQSLKSIYIYFCFCSSK